MYICEYMYVCVHIHVYKVCPLHRHTDDLEVLSYHTLSIRTQENVQIQDSTSRHPGESRSWLQHHLYIRENI